FDNFCVYYHSISKISHSFILAGHRKYWTDQPIFLHLSIGKPTAVHKVHSGFLKPANIIGVVDNSHLVCLIILSLMFICHHLSPLTLALLPALFYFSQPPTYKIRGAQRETAWTEKNLLPWLRSVLYLTKSQK